MKTPRALMHLIPAFVVSAGCSSTAEPPEDPNPSGGGGEPSAEESTLAAAATPDPSFLDAYAETNRFRNGHPRAITILPDGSEVLFLRSESRSVEGRLYAFDVASGEERVLLEAAQLLDGDDEELTAEERARRERMRVTARGLASFSVSPDGAQLLVPLSGRLFLVDRARIGEEGAIRELESDNGPAIDPRFSPTGTHIACVRGGDLYVIDVATGAERRLTTRESEEIEHGLAEFVAQEEMGRMRGYWWAPDGQSLAYQRTDHTGMERMHILDPAHPEREPQSWPYPRPGQQNARVTLGLLPISGGSTRWVEWDHDAYPYLAAVQWGAQGPLTILVQDREQEEETLLRVDLSNGRTAALLTERDEAWLNLDESVPRWIRRGEALELLWSTEREGDWRLEVRDEAGQPARWLTPAGFGYRGLVAVDAERDRAWVTASEDPTSTQVWRISLSGEVEPEAITEGAGEHSAVVSRDGEVIVLSRHAEDGTIESVVERAGERVGALSSGAEEPPLEANLTFETVGRREWRAVVARPHDFDEDATYPVILHVYAGPHVRYVTRTPQRYLLSQWQADHHYIVVTIDGRGTPGRGREWERAIDEDFISAPLEDQIEALQQLGDRIPQMDMDRVGVWGWSFGGYFSAMAALQRPDVFRAGVAGAPVSEWRDYDTHYTERYLGLPEEEGAEGAYQRSSALTFAARPIGEAGVAPLLIIHGTADDNVYFSHALKLQDATFHAGRPAELLALSGLTHMVPEPSTMRRMHARIMSFFEQHLRGE